MASQVREAGAANAGLPSSIDRSVLRALANYPVGARPRDLTTDTTSGVAAVTDALFRLEDEGHAYLVEQAGIWHLTTLGWAKAAL